MKCIYVMSRETKCVYNKLHSVVHVILFYLLGGKPDILVVFLINSHVLEKLMRYAAKAHSQTSSR